MLLSHLLIEKARWTAVLFLFCLLAVSGVALAAKAYEHSDDFGSAAVNLAKEGQGGGGGHVLCGLTPPAEDEAPCGVGDDDGYAEVGAASEDDDAAAAVDDL